VSNDWDARDADGGSPKMNNPIYGHSKEGANCIIAYGQLPPLGPRKIAPHRPRRFEKSKFHHRSSRQLRDPTAVTGSILISTVRSESVMNIANSSIIELLETRHHGLRSSSNLSKDARPYRQSSFDNRHRLRWGRLG
jgi:hypothetical protein